MNPKIAGLTMSERRELVYQIGIAHSKGIRLDPQLVAEAKDSLILRKPKLKSDEPTKEQINRMFLHFGKEPIRRCKHCGRPVRETIGKSGYCKKCIALAKEKAQ